MSSIISKAARIVSKSGLSRDHWEAGVYMIKDVIEHRTSKVTVIKPLRVENKVTIIDTRPMLPITKKTYHIYPVTTSGIKVIVEGRIHKFSNDPMLDVIIIDAILEARLDGADV